MDFYQGFWLADPEGNNAFSFDQRQNKKIFVAPLIEGSLKDLEVGEEVVFSEFFDGQEINKKGLKYFVYLKTSEKDIFIFDNHNHAFFFWMYGLKEGLFKKGLTLLHVDQHKDTRIPLGFPNFQLDNIDLAQAFRYTNDVLNVGNFLPAANHLKLFNKIEFLDNKESFLKEYSFDCILDLDMDIFAPDMDYIPREVKLNKIRRLLKGASFITIATSPYFMDQKQAIKIIHELFDGSL